MERIKGLIIKIIKGISIAGLRFPMTMVCLIAAAAIIFRLIAMNMSLPLLEQKLVFTFVVGAVLGMAVQILVERLNIYDRRRIFAYIASLVLLVGYFLILLSALEINAEITIRSFVAVFALVCMVLWIPSYKTEVNFNQTALIHFKSFFTSALYSGVLMAGIAAIIATIDTLLFNVNEDAYAYTMTIIWVVFAPVYYLSLLPKFNSKEKTDTDVLERASSYPRYLDILVSYIAIPLITAYTLVLIIYFLKILFTLTWPSGQVGPMVLVYSIAGFFIFVLSSLLDNRFAVFYRRVFPKVLVPLVIMQLISVGIRLNAYGVTEARYYVAIFGIFSILVGVLLSIKPDSRNGLIALLAAFFAIVSIIPPIDAFTVSRQSQINRIENILENEGMLVNGEIIKNENATKEAKIEVTNILYYLERSSSLEYIEWIPEDFMIYKDMESLFGFEPTYPNYPGELSFYSVALDSQQPLPVSGYDMLMNAFIGRHMNEKEITDRDFELEGYPYKLKITSLSNNDAHVAVLDVSGKELIGTDLYDYAKKILDEVVGAKSALSPEEMSFEVSNDEYKLKVIFQHINYTAGNDADAGTDYSFYVMFAVK